MRHLFLFSIVIAMVLVLMGCARLPGQGNPVAIDLARVERGVGSPIPLTVVVEYRLSSTCAQLASITNHVEAGRIAISIREADFGQDCQPEGFSYQIAIPLNSVGLLEGDYFVRVNGVDAGSFTFDG